MTGRRLLLASASPRRRRLLYLLGLEFEVDAVDVPEDVPDTPVDATDFAESLAVDKALAARALNPDSPAILTADTVVVVDGHVLGKPSDDVEAASMLRVLSGDPHSVVTAVALVSPHLPAPLSIAVSSQVLMRELDEDAIASWIARGESLGCAGAYNIEHHLADVATTECYQNVAGLPLCHLYLFLRETIPDIPGLCAPLAACEATRSTACALGRELIPDG